MTGAISHSKGWFNMRRRPSFCVVATCQAGEGARGWEWGRVREGTQAQLTLVIEVGFVGFYASDYMRLLIFRWLTISYNIWHCYLVLSYRRFLFSLLVSLRQGKDTDIWGKVKASAKRPPTSVLCFHVYNIQTKCILTFQDLNIAFLNVSTN